MARLAWWLARGSDLLLAASLVVAAAALVEALRDGVVSWVVALVAIALSLWVAGAGLGALAQIARPYAVPRSWSQSSDEEEG